MVPEQLQKAKCDEKLEPTIVVLNKEATSSNKKRITQGDVLREQYKALHIKQDNVLLKKRKLELEIFLLEERLKGGFISHPQCQQQTLTTIKLSPITGSSFNILE